MKIMSIAAGFVLAMVAASSSAAATNSCQVGSVTPSPDSKDYTVIFDEFWADGETKAKCKVVVPLGQGLDDDVLVVYSADYRGFVAGGVGRVFIKHKGKLYEVVLDASDPDSFGEDFDFRGYVGSDGDELISEIRLALSEFDDPFSAFLQLDSIDYSELARSTRGDIQKSVDALSAARTAVVTHLNTTFDLLGGAGQELDGPDRFGALAGVGSVTVGANGQLSLGDGFSVLGGVAYTDQGTVGAHVSGVLATGAVRYVTPGSDFMRPFGEAGLKAAPGLGLSFTREYETSVGTTTATGDTTGSFFGAYVRGGILFAPDASNSVVLSASYARDWLSAAAYDEGFSDTNLFAASVAEQTGTFDTVKVGADWTTRMTEELKLTFSGAVGHTFAQSALDAQIAFGGNFSGAGVSESFVQYGARLDYEIAQSTTVGLFVHGATGAVSGTHAQVGGNLNVRF